MSKDAHHLVASNHHQLQASQIPLANPLRVPAITVHPSVPKVIAFEKQARNKKLNKTYKGHKQTTSRVDGFHVQLTFAPQGTAR